MGPRLMAITKYPLQQYCLSFGQFETLVSSLQYGNSM